MTPTQILTRQIRTHKVVNRAFRLRDEVDAFHRNLSRRQRLGDLDPDIMDEYREVFNELVGAAANCELLMEEVTQEVE